MRYRHLLPVLLLNLAVPLAADGQTRDPEPPHALDGAWELVAFNGQPLPLTPVRDGGDPSECGEHGEFAGHRVGEGRLVIRVGEMWMGPRSGRWEGGVYAYVPEEILCRAAGGALVVLRRDVHNRARPARDVQPAWRSGSYGFEDSTGSLSVAGHSWKVMAAPAPGGSTVSLQDDEGNTWTFRGATGGARFETPGHAVVLGDFDGDGRTDQVSVKPGRYETSTMMARLAAGGVDRVTDVPAGAQVMLAPRGSTWRNADGRVLRLSDRDAVIVSVEPAPERSDVTVFYIRNGEWIAWEYSPD